MDLVGKSAFVTGGSGGLGRQTCLALAEAGCDIVVGYCAGVDRVRAVQDAVSKTGRRAATVQLDQSDPDSVRRAVEDAVAAFRQALKISPRDPLSQGFLGWTLGLAGRREGELLAEQAVDPRQLLVDRSQPVTGGLQLLVLRLLLDVGRPQGSVAMLQLLPDRSQLAIDNLPAPG